MSRKCHLYDILIYLMMNYSNHEVIKMFIQTNPNPNGSYVGDCVVRAIALAEDRTWNETYINLCLTGLVMYDMPSSNRVWDEYLKSLGYKKHVVPNDCPKCYTIKDFCGEFFKGTYIVGTGTHVVCVKDGSRRRAIA